MTEPIKRLSLEELRETCKEIFYNHLASEGYVTKCKSYKNVSTKKGQTVADLVHNSYKQELKLTDARIEMFKKQLNNVHQSAYLEEFNNAKNLLIQLKEALAVSCLKSQKEIYSKYKRNILSKTKIQFPLDKLINSYYDNYILEVVYYDDVSTLKGKYAEYTKLKTKEARVEFIKANTEITNLGLCILSRSDTHLATILLEGECKEMPKQGKVYSKVNGIYCIDCKFADFNTLTLNDTLKIDFNNDLQQDFQSKIDLDKEDLTIEADKYICEDNYKIISGKGRSNKLYFIRYECPSTKRVYFNNLNLENLKISEFYKDKDFTSYIDAWWNITHLGANPYVDVSTRC